MNPTAIRSVTGRRVWDSRARPTVEVEIALSGGARGRAIAPAGASRGSAEAVDLRDGGAAFGGRDVRRAIAAVDGEIAAALAGLDACDQEAADNRLVALDGTADKSRLGGNALVAASMAVAHAAAAAKGVPLWRHLAGDAEPGMPLPEIQIFGGGAHAARRVDVQDFMAIATGASDYAQALDWTAEIYRAAGEIMAERGLLSGTADEGGFWPAFDSNEHALETLVRAIERAGLAPGEQVGISLDVAASEFGAGGRYRLARDGRDLDTDGMCALLGDWIGRFPIVSIEDPLAEDDFDGLAAFTSAYGARVQIVGDDALVSSADRVRQAAAAGRLQRGAAQAQPGRHAERVPGGAGGGARGRVRRRGLGALGRDRGRDDRPSRARLGGAAAQGRLDRPWRAHRQVERRAADRRNPAGGRPLAAGRAVSVGQMMRVVFHYDTGPALARRLAEIAGDGLDIAACPAADDAQFATLMEEADVLWHVLRPVSAADIEAAPRLRLIQKIGVGVNTIDLDAARARDIRVCNMPGTNTRAVAEMTLALMLAALRRLPAYGRAMREGTGWAMESAMQDRLGEIGGRVVGLVGFGAVPQALAPVLKALGARMLYTARAPKDEADGLAEWRTLPALLEESDIVSLHVPETRRPSA